MDAAVGVAAEASSMRIWCMPGGDGACFVQHWPSGRCEAFPTYDAMCAATDALEVAWKMVLVDEQIQA